MREILNEIPPNVRLVLTALFAVLGLWLFFKMFANVFGFLVILAIAAGMGYAAEQVMPTKNPYGIVGNTFAGLLGAWLGTKLLGTWGPAIKGMHIFPGIGGAAMVTFLFHLKMRSDRAKSMDSLKAKADDNDPLIMSELDGYRLVEELGTGANAKVYKGLPDESLNEAEAVACKILKEEATKGEEFMSRYNREIRIAHKLDHPGIIKVHGWGQQDGLYFITMEYVKGGTLADEIVEGGLPLDKVVDYMSQLMAALQHAHDQQVVHRDIKPENILFSEGKCKVSDFGLGRALVDDVSLTKEGTVLGTPAYIAPEQIHGKKPTAACDQYALGVLFYELLTGSRPFISDDSLALLMQQLQAKAPSPKESRPELSDEICAIVARMMEKKPEDRYPELKDALADLKALGKDGKPEAE